jgi:ATP-binding cassette subfamily F protein uup
MALISLREVCWGFSQPPLLENITLQIEKGERVGLLGRNGVGKSTLLKLIGGKILPDSGDIWRQQGVTIAALEQDVPAAIGGTIFDVVADGLNENDSTPAKANLFPKAAGPSQTGEPAGRILKLQPGLDTADGWKLLKQIESVLSRTGLDPNQKFTDLSAGMKRRALFARAIAREPDLLLLDEPTNHLDVDAIIWLEKFILRQVKTLLFVSHDRVFLQKIANSILELDRGRLVSYHCDYTSYLNRRQADAEAEEKLNRVFDKKLSQEEAWIRQGIKARRTRNEGRVRALEMMRAAYRARRKKIGNVRLQIQEAERTGKLVIEAQDVAFRHGEITLFRDFSTTIMRGDKVGVIGPNGVGKTTLLKVLLKQIEPVAGRVRHGTHLQTVYFDQLRVLLDEQRTVQENIGDGNDYIIFNGQKRHVISYLQDFLFSPLRCRMPVYVLSGGEKNRLMLARLFTMPANVIVLDEPTNDLDAETLELLEDLLLEYKGTLLIVSHDRAFLNNVVTSTLVFEGNARVIEYAGGYDDWLLQRPKMQQSEPSSIKTGKKNRQHLESSKVRKLGYMEKRELQDLPQKIDALEAEQKELYACMADPLYYKKEKNEITRMRTRLAQVEQDIEKAYLRWEALEAIEKQ